MGGFNVVKLGQTPSCYKFLIHSFHVRIDVIVYGSRTHWISNVTIVHYSAAFAMLQAKHAATNWQMARMRTSPAMTQRKVSRKVRRDSPHEVSKAWFCIHGRFPESNDSIGSKQHDLGY